MAPEVVLRKLDMLRRLLTDLEPFADADREVIAQNHYAVERILELLATNASHLVAELLAKKGETTASLHEVFRRAGEQELVPSSLTTSLQDAATMRDRLLYHYDEIDPDFLHAAIPRALRDFRQLVAELESHARDRG